MVINELNKSEYKGLSSNEVQIRLAKYGYNELPNPDNKNILLIAKKILLEPMILLLLICGFIYFILGDIKEATVLLGCIVVIVGITIYQENKTEKALEALRDLSSPRALVIRNGESERIAGREVVIDDIIIVNEGDRVPADAVLLFSSNLMIDESLLTGESMPVRKISATPEAVMSIPGGDNTVCIFSGTLIVDGYGVAMVKRIGKNTSIGQIGESLNKIGQESTRLQGEIKNLVLKISLIGAFICIAIVIIYALTRGSWLNGFLSGLALAMGILPEEFPLIFTIFLAFGAWRMSRKKILSRNLPAIENLGAATVLCVDKTGTLTFNKMSVKCLFNGKEYYYEEDGDLPKNFYEIAEYANLATRKDPLEPMELAIKKFLDKNLSHIKIKHSNWSLIKEYKLSRELLAITHVWQSPDLENLLIAAKGAPEAIMELCHFKEGEKKIIINQVDKMASSGFRVIGIARAVTDKGVLHPEQHDYSFEFLGLVGLADTIRPTVNEALRHCYQAGLRVIMITGDYAVTAKNIAGQIGLRDSDVITGPELELMSDADLENRIKGVNIFARIMPEQKLRIVNALKSGGEIVAMTGDGVNDAPALEAANIGVAMGEKGTDVAREAADIVILDDDFSSIVHGVKMGRTIFDNLKKAMAYIVAIHIPIAGISFIPVVANWSLILLPIHIVFMEIVVDPACSLVFESSSAEDDIMKRPPRKLSSPLFSRNSLIFSLIQGLIILVILFSLTIIFRHYGYAEDNLRTMIFSGLVFSNMGLIFVNYSWTKNIFKNILSLRKSFWLIEIFTLFLLLSTIYIPSLRELFKFSYLSITDAMIAFMVIPVIITVGELIKLIRKRYIIKAS